jgi:hypothetical protein
MTTPTTQEPNPMTNSSLDRLTASLTAFDSFDALLATHPTYSPSLLARDGERTMILADAFDAAMKARGSTRRAWRGTSEAATAPRTVLSARLTSRCPHGKPSNQCCGFAEWLQVIHAINRAHPTEVSWIGEPTHCYEWWAGPEMWCEEYVEFRVILGDELTNYVQAKTPAAAEALRAAFLEVVGVELQA